MSEATNETAWGRVDETNTVYVRDDAGERAVGQYPDGTADEALAYFQRKFADLAGQVTLLEQRVNKGTGSADLSSTVARLQEQLREPAAVGDLAALRARVDKLGGKANELSDQQKAEREAARATAIAQREAIVVEAERLAAQPEASIRWKETSQAIDQLFTEWQAAQRSGPQVPKGQADALWKRFRTARQHLDTARRNFFTQMDATNKDVKHRKERIIASAEALASKGADAIPEYRRLLDEWKESGHASRKLDDQLWARFKAAGDVLYSRKAEEVAQSSEEEQANLVLKEALLDEAEPLLQATDHESARKQLTSFQLRWDEIGRIPRDAMRPTDARIRAIEDHVKGLQEAHWRASNPETKARSEGLRGQLESSIADLTAEIAAAKTPKAKAEAEEKLATQRSWLAALGE